MGYRKVPTILTLTEFKDHDGLVVRMKPISYGKVRRLVALNDDNSTESTEEMASTFQEHLVSWNLEDEAGAPVGVSEAEVDEQDFDFVMEIISGWLDQVTGPSEDLGKGSASGATFPGAPVTMELL